MAFTVTAFTRYTVRLCNYPIICDKSDHVMDAIDSSQTIPALNKVCNLSNGNFSTITGGLTSCKYYNINNISTLRRFSDGLFILHVNIRSLNKNFDGLYLNL